MKWIENSGEDCKKYPKWRKRAAIDDDGTIFFPAGNVASEMLIFFEISWEANQRVIVDSKHLYVPIDWLIRNHPKAATDLERIKAKIQNKIKDEND